MLAVLGPLWIIGAQVLHSTLYVGLRWTAAYGELDREWLARLNGEKLIPMLAWSVLAAVTLILPMLVFEQWPTTYAAIVGAASGPIGAWLGRSAQSFGAGSSADKTGAAWWTGMMREAAITIATLLFAATLFMLLGRLGAIIVERLAALLADVSWLDRTWLIALVVIILLVLLSVYCGARININRFSLHGVYRNRLARAFIGTARPPARTQARRLHALRSGRQSAHAGPVSGQGTARHSVPGGERHAQPAGGRAERLGGAQGRAVHHHAAARRRRLSRREGCAGRCGGSLCQDRGLCRTGA